MPLDIKLAGMKRKVSPSPTAAAEGKLPWLFVPRKKTRTSQSVWTCALCCVSCTSSDGLAEHYLGRKHRAKVEESKVKKEEGAPDKVENKRPLQNATKDVGEESTVKKAEGALDEIDDKHPQKHATKVVSEEPKAEGEEGALDKIDVKHPQTNATKVVVKESKLKKGEGALDKLGVNHPQRNATKIVGKESKLKKMEAALGKIDDKPPQKNTNMAGGVSSSDSPSVAKNVNPKKKMRGSKKQLKSNADGPTLKKLETQDGKKSSLPFWCEYCSIGCNSVFMLEAHLKGKKHAARLLRLEKSGGAGNVQSIHSSAGQATGASATTMEGEVVDSLNEGEEVHVG